MSKSADAFRTISEVADDLDVPQHVLRFWESKFTQIRPLKRGGGRRYYRPEDVDLLRGIRTLLYSDGYTIKGVQKVLRDQGVRAVTEAGRGEGHSLPREVPEPPATTLPAQSPAPASAAPAPVVAVPVVESDPRQLSLLGPPGGLTPADRDRLTKILDELVQAKQTLESRRRG